MTNKLIKLSSMLIDVEAEDKGQWVESSDFPGVSFLVRSVESPVYKNAWQKLIREIQERRSRKEVIPAEEVDRLNYQLSAQHLILDWKGIDTPFDKDQAEAWLTDRRYRAIAEAIAKAAGKVGIQELVYVEETAKN